MKLTNEQAELMIGIIAEHTRITKEWRALPGMCGRTAGGPDATYMSRKANQAMDIAARLKDELTTNMQIAIVERGATTPPAAMLAKDDWRIADKMDASKGAELLAYLRTLTVEGDCLANWQVNG